MSEKLFSYAPIHGSYGSNSDDPYPRRSKVRCLVEWEDELPHKLLGHFVEFSRLYSEQLSVIRFRSWDVIDVNNHVTDDVGSMEIELETEAAKELVKILRDENDCPQASWLDELVSHAAHRHQEAAMRNVHDWMRCQVNDTYNQASV